MEITAHLLKVIMRVTNNHMIVRDQKDMKIIAASFIIQAAVLGGLSCAIQATITAQQGAHLTQPARPLTITEPGGEMYVCKPVW